VTGVHVSTVDGADRAEPYPFAGTQVEGLVVNFVLAGTRPVRRVRVAQQQRVRVDAMGSTPDQRNRSLLIHRARRQRCFFGACAGKKSDAGRGCAQLACTGHAHGAGIGHEAAGRHLAAALDLRLALGLVAFGH